MIVTLSYPLEIVYLHRVRFLLDYEAVRKDLTYFALVSSQSTWRFLNHCNSLLVYQINNMFLLTSLCVCITCWVVKSRNVLRLL